MTDEAARKQLGRGWHSVTMRELRDIWAQMREQGVCYNGCTAAALVNRYGRDNLTHVSGVGWFKRHRGIKHTAVTF